MNWIAVTLLSAVVLGCCELFIKHAVRENAVLPVLVSLTLYNAGVWAALLAWHAFAPSTVPTMLILEKITVAQHLEIAVKSGLVGASWICSYLAVKHLPVTLASPMRATSPIWTLLGALVLLHEKPAAIKLGGAILTVVGVFGLSWAGRWEGINFRRDRWVGLMFLSTILSASSVLYDKHLFAEAKFEPSTVQAWFYFYLAAIFLVVGAVWRFGVRDRAVFRWRWSIPLISVSLLLADFIYFHVLRDPEALIVLVAALRRVSTLVAFIGGWWFFGEVNIRRKLPAVVTMLAGIALMALG